MDTTNDTEADNPEVGPDAPEAAAPAPVDDVSDPYGPVPAAGASTGAGPADPDDGTALTESSVDEEPAPAEPPAAAVEGSADDEEAAAEEPAVVAEPVGDEPAGADSPDPGDDDRSVAEPTAVDAEDDTAVEATAASDLDAPPAPPAPTDAVEASPAPLAAADAEEPPAAQEAEAVESAAATEAEEPPAAQDTAAVGPPVTPEADAVAPPAAPEAPTAEIGAGDAPTEPSSPVPDAAGIVVVPPADPAPAATGVVVDPVATATAAPAPPTTTAGGSDDGAGGSWAVRITLALGVLVVLAVLAFVGVVVASRGGPGPEPARAEAEAFVRAWSAGDTAAMQALVDDPDASVAADLEETLGGLPVTKTTVTLVPGPLTGERDERRAAVTIELQSPELPPITYDSAIDLRKIDDENWRVRWARTTIHPELVADKKFDRISTWAPRGMLLDANGQPLATSNGQVIITLRPLDVVDRPALEAALASTLGIDAATVEKAFQAARATGSAPIKTVSWAEYVAAKPVIYDIKGLRFPTTGDIKGTGSDAIQEQVVGRTSAATPEQAAALGPPYKAGDEIGVSGLQASQQKTLGGLPATEVRIVDGAGQVVRSMLKVDGSPPQNVRTTIDPHIQGIAEQALRSSLGPNQGGALVAMDRNGGVKAMATPGAGGFNWATAKWPPGSTFKVVTASALLAHGLTPDSPLSCPPTFTAAGQPFRNFEGEAEANLTFTRAFTISCNTAFLMAAQQLTGDEMRQAGARFGFGVPYDAGIPMTVQGSFPDDGDGALKSSMAIGQGRVESNPLHMASVAATVMSGQWKSPTFLADRPADLPVGEPLEPRVREQLEGFMRSVVERGTATAAQVPGKVVHGKTGTAEYSSNPNDPTHAWFIGYSGDLAIAVVVDKGGVGGRVAAPIAAKFFAAV